MCIRVQQLDEKMKTPKCIFKTYKEKSKKWTKLCAFVEKLGTGN